MLAALQPADLFQRYPDGDALQALQGHRVCDVTVAGTVASEPTFFVGRRTHARHEEFDIITQHGLRIDVIDNVDLAPPIGVRPGDTVAVRGQFIPRRGEPLVHDTHHCPGAGWHAGGWIEWRGRVYQ